MMRPVLLEFGLIDALDWQTVAASMIPIAIVAASLVELNVWGADWT